MIKTSVTFSSTNDEEDKAKENGESFSHLDVFKIIDAIEEILKEEDNLK